MLKIKRFRSFKARNLRIIEKRRFYILLSIEKNVYLVLIIIRNKNFFYVNNFIN